MIKNISRDYEVSIWTLQDSFIAILKQSNLENKGTIQDPQITLKDDGDNTFSFKIPMYIRENTGVTEPFFKDGNVWRENPIWYTVRNGNLIANLRKIKVIFDKGGENEKVFEYIINNVKEEHEGYSKYCEVECGGLAFHELGKQGYEIELSQAIYDKDVQDWKENPIGTMPINNINYWIEKVLAGSNWIYDINMDWSLYDGITGSRANNSVRQRTKVYDQPYISNWILNETNSELVANSIVTDIDKLEKRRIVEKSESNRYNLLMAIAETFQVFCRFEYKHDDNYHITNRKVIFYNNFVKEAERYVDLNYGYNVSKITREMDSTDLISKMYVSTLTGTGTLTNEVNLQDVDANLSLENYLFNFEYLYKIGTISQEQYEAVRELEVKLRGKNIEYVENSKILTNLENEKNKLEAKLETLNNIIEEAEKIITDTEREDEVKNAVSVYTESNPLQMLVIHNYVDKNWPYVKIPKKLGGIITNSLQIYSEKIDNLVNANTKITNFTIERDEYGFLSKISFYVPGDNPVVPSYLYLTCNFNPKNPNEIIRSIWAGKKDQSSNEQSEIKQRLYGLKEDEPEEGTIYYELDFYNNRNEEILQEKKQLIQSFERLMGPAIREGTWQPEDSYANYHTDENFTATLSGITTNSEDIGFIWDTELFDGELKSSYKFGVNETRNYFFVRLDTIKKVIDTNGLNFIYRDIYWQNIDPKLYSENDLRANHYLYYGSDNGCKFIFLKDKNRNEIFPALLLLGIESLDEIKIGNNSYTIASQINNGARLSNIVYNSDGTVTETLIENVSATLLNDKYYTIVYPRFFINADKYITTLPETKIYYDGEALKEFTDYKAPQYRDGKFYLTLNIDLSNYKNNGEYKFNYFQSSAGEAMYLDAVEVLRENSVPKVSYTVEPATLDKNFMLTAYNRLGQLAHINDQELKFENVRGYFSEMNLNLDKPWEDNYTIKNYKTKFEDLFSTIVAQTEAMQKNSQLFSAVSNAFNTGGWLTDAMIGNIKDRLDFSIPTPEDIYRQYEPAIRDMLTESFNEAGEVLVAAQGSVEDINNLNIANAVILESFKENIQKNLTPATFVDFPRESITFKIGDIWRFTDEKGISHEYLATENSSQINYKGENKTKSLKGWTPVQDGRISGITGTSIDIDAKTGNIKMQAENKIEIQSKTKLDLVSADIYIVGNNSVNIGSKWVNISGYNGGINIVTTSITEETVGKENDGTIKGTSAVKMNQDGIVIAANAGIKIKSATGIDIYSSDNSDTSVVSINRDAGIFLGSNKALKMYSGNLVVNEGGIIKSGTGSSVELAPTRILFGVSDPQGGTALEITSKRFIIGAASLVQSNNEGDKGLIGSKYIAGVLIQKECIRLATQTNGKINYISMDEEGIKIANVNNERDGAIVRVDQNGVLIGAVKNKKTFVDLISEGQDAEDDEIAKNISTAKFQVYAPNFVVDADGYLYAYKATIAGDIRATSLTIGGVNSEAYVQERINSHFNSDIKSYVESIQQDLQAQVDGEIDTWFFAGTPEPTTASGVSQISGTLEKEWGLVWDNGYDDANKLIILRHNSDVYYDIGVTTKNESNYSDTAGRAYRFIAQENTPGDISTLQYYWNEISDTATTEALAKAAKAQETADGKITTYTGESAPQPSQKDIDDNITYTKNPQTPSIGDLYIYTGDGQNEIYRCKKYSKNDEDYLIWESIRDQSFANKNETNQKIKAAIEKGEAEVEAIHNGKTGIAFASSTKNIGAVLNQDQGLVITGITSTTSGLTPVFRATNNAMGFCYQYEQDGQTVEDYTMYLQDGNAYFAGNITATSGKIGKWNIASNGQLVFEQITDDNTYKTALSPYGAWPLTESDNTKNYWALLIQRTPNGETAADRVTGIKWDGSFFTNSAKIKGEITATAFTLENGVTIPQSKITNLTSDLNSIKAVSGSVDYQISNSGTSVPSSTWQTTVPATTDSKPYLWTRTTTTYSGGNTSISYSVSYKGKDGTNGTNGTNGKNGKYVTKFTPIYYLKTNSTAVLNPTTTNLPSSDVTNTWTKVIPTYQANATYYRSDIQEWSDNSAATFTAVYIDYGLTVANSTATSASTTASTTREALKKMAPGSFPNGVYQDYTLGNKTYSVALTGNKGLFIGGGSYVTIASQNSDSAVITLDKSGIALNGASIKLTATNNNQTSTISLNGNGIDLGSTGTLKIDTQNFKINGSGSVTMTGTIYTTSGTIGGWNIGQSGISYAEDHGNGYSEDVSLCKYNSWSAGNGGADSWAFLVRKIEKNSVTAFTGIKWNGSMIMSGDASLSGAIYSSSGQIGGWKIKNNLLYSPNFTNDGTDWPSYSSTSGMWLYAGGTGNNSYSEMKVRSCDLNTFYLVGLQPSQITGADSKGGYMFAVGELASENTTPAFSNKASGIRYYYRNESMSERKHGWVELSGTVIINGHRLYFSSDAPDEVYAVENDVYLFSSKVPTNNGAWTWTPVNVYHGVKKTA